MPNRKFVEDMFDDPRTIGLYQRDKQFYSQDWEDEESLRQLCLQGAQDIERRCRHVRQNEIMFALESGDIL